VLNRTNGVISQKVELLKLIQASKIRSRNNQYEWYINNKEVHRVNITSRILFPALPDFLRSSVPGMGSTQSLEYN
jgi:hypothetical protein